MKILSTLILCAMLLAGCSSFNTVLLYRNATPYQGFLDDRHRCVQEAQACIAKKYANSSYMGEYVDQLQPSRGVYLGCMAARGYEPVFWGYGWSAPVLVKMTDYLPGRDCYDR